MQVGWDKAWFKYWFVVTGNLFHALFYFIIWDAVSFLCHWNVFPFLFNFLSLKQLCASTCHLSFSSIIKSDKLLLILLTKVNCAILNLNNMVPKNIKRLNLSHNIITYRHVHPLEIQGYTMQRRERPGRGEQKPSSWWQIGGESTQLMSISPFLFTVNFLIRLIKIYLIPLKF